MPALIVIAALWLGASLLGSAVCPATPGIDEMLGKLDRTLELGRDGQADACQMPNSSALDLDREMEEFQRCVSRHAQRMQEQADIVFWSLEAFVSSVQNSLCDMTIQRVFKGVTSLLWGREAV